MFQSSGYFKAVTCPYFASGLCERPYCHFRHVRPSQDERPSTSLWSTGVTPSSGGAGNSSLLAKVGETIQKLQRDIERDQQLLNGHRAVKPRSIDSFAGSVAEKYNNRSRVTLSDAKASSSGAASTATAADDQASEFSYEPTPISELKKKRNSAEKYKVENDPPKTEPVVADDDEEYTPEPKKPKLNKGGEVEEPLGNFSDADTSDDEPGALFFGSKKDKSKSDIEQSDKDDNTETEIKKEVVEKEEDKEIKPAVPGDILAQIMQDSNKSLKLKGVKHNKDGSMVILNKKEEKPKKKKIKEEIVESVPTAAELGVELSDEDDENGLDPDMLSTGASSPQESVPEPEPEPEPEVEEKKVNHEELELAKKRANVWDMIKSGAIVLGPLARDEQSSQPEIKKETDGKTKEIAEEEASKVKEKKDDKKHGKVKEKRKSERDSDSDARSKKKVKLESESDLVEKEKMEKEKKPDKESEKENEEKDESSESAVSSDSDHRSKRKKSKKRKKKKKKHRKKKKKKKKRKHHKHATSTESESESSESSADETKSRRSSSGSRSRDRKRKKKRRRSVSSSSSSSSSSRERVRGRTASGDRDISKPQPITDQNDIKSPCKKKEKEEANKSIEVKPDKSPLKSRATSVDTLNESKEKLNIKHKPSKIKLAKEFDLFSALSADPPLDTSRGSDIIASNSSSEKLKLKPKPKSITKPRRSSSNVGSSANESKSDNNTSLKQGKKCISSSEEDLPSFTKFLEDPISVSSPKVKKTTEMKQQLSETFIIKDDQDLFGGAISDIKSKSQKESKQKAEEKISKDPLKRSHSKDHHKERSDRGKDRTEQKVQPEKGKDHSTEKDKYAQNKERTDRSNEKTDHNKDRSHSSEKHRSRHTSSQHKSDHKSSKSPHTPSQTKSPSRTFSQTKSPSRTPSQTKSPSRTPSQTKSPAHTLGQTKSPAHDIMKSPSQSKPPLVSKSDLTKSHSKSSHSRPKHSSGHSRDSSHGKDASHRSRDSSRSSKDTSQKVHSSSSHHHTKSEHEAAVKYVSELSKSNKLNLQQYAELKAQGALSRRTSEPVKPKTTSTLPPTPAQRSRTVSGSSGQKSPSQAAITSLFGEESSDESSDDVILLDSGGNIPVPVPKQKSPAPAPFFPSPIRVDSDPEVEEKLTHGSKLSRKPAPPVSHDVGDDVDWDDDPFMVEETDTHQKRESYGGPKKRIAHEGSSRAPARRPLPNAHKTFLSPAEQMHNRFKQVQEAANANRPSGSTSGGASIYGGRDPQNKAKQRVAHTAKWKNEEEVTPVQTSRPGKREAHKPKQKILARPIIPNEYGSKVPTNIRQRYLNQLIDECLNIYQDQQAAFDRALEEEKKIYERSTSKVVYLNVAVKAIRSLRNELSGGAGTSTAPVQKKTWSHEAVLGGAKAAKTTFTVHRSGHGIKTDVNLTPGIFSQYLQQYILTEEQLIENGFPSVDPDNPNLVKFRPREDATSKGLLKLHEKVCCRCGNRFRVYPDGTYATKEECCYHWGRAYKRKVSGQWDSRYNCCSGDLNSEPCCSAPRHVHDTNKASDLEGYVRTYARPAASDGSYGVYALDCEMVYTISGCELARITVIDMDMDIVYETLVKPDSKVIDYNTRFSGLEEGSLDRVKTTIKDVQSKLRRLFSEKTILIGHSLESDFTALKFLHSTVVDTSVVFPHRLGPPFKRALKNLMADILKKIIQDDIGGHDSKEDAAACMELMVWKVKEELKVKH